MFPVRKPGRPLGFPPQQEPRGAGLERRSSGSVAARGCVCTINGAPIDTVECSSQQSMNYPIEQSPIANDGSVWEPGIAGDSSFNPAGLMIGDMLDNFDLETDHHLTSEALSQAVELGAAPYSHMLPDPLANIEQMQPMEQMSQHQSALNRFLSPPRHTPLHLLSLSETQPAAALARDISQDVPMLNTTSAESASHAKATRPPFFRVTTTGPDIPSW